MGWGGGVKDEHPQRGPHREDGGKEVPKSERPPHRRQPYDVGCRDTSPLITRTQLPLPTIVKTPLPPLLLLDVHLVLRLLRDQPPEVIASFADIIPIATPRAESWGHGNSSRRAAGGCRVRDSTRQGVVVPSALQRGGSDVRVLCTVLPVRLLRHRVECESA